MRVAIVGAGGQLGAALVHEYAASHETTAFTRSQLDVSDEAAVAAAVAQVKPELILNAAAFTDVDAAEDHPVEALNGNAFGVRALARSAREHGATLVHYSSDFVFDGRATVPYTESDQPNPRSVYAASKLLGEWFAQDAPRAYVLRVESLFGRAPGGGPSRGSVASIVNKLKAGDSPPVFEDRTVTPTYLIDVVRATRMLIDQASPAGLYHCVNSETCTWLGFAQELTRLLGIEPRLTPVRMADMTLRASRPMYSALSNEKLRQVGIDMPTWRDALVRYVQDLRRAGEWPG
jgi:dTDP-4-dehydrorhamnose reductase